MSLQIGGNTVVDDNEKGIFSGSVNPGQFTTAESLALSIGWNSDQNGTLIWNTEEEELQVWADDEWVGIKQDVPTPPNIGSVTLSDAKTGTGRFTSNEFPFATEMLIDGNPLPTFGLKARVFGATYDVNVRSDVIDDVENTTVSNWNQAKIWSADLEAERGWYDNGSTNTAAFDGVTGQYAEVESTGETMTWTPTGGVAYKNKVEVYCSQPGVSVQVNDGSIYAVNNNSWTPIIDGSSGTISKLHFISTAGSYIALGAIRIDGRILVDSNVNNSTAGSFDVTNLTFASDEKLDLLSYGTDVKMVDAAGNDATYQPETSNITQIEDGGLLVNGFLNASSNDYLRQAQADGTGDMAAGTLVNTNIQPGSGAVINPAIAPTDTTNGESTVVYTFDPPLEVTTGVLNVYGGSRFNAGYPFNVKVVYTDNSNDTNTQTSSLNNWFWQVTFNTTKSVRTVEFNSPGYLVVGGVSISSNNLITSEAYKLTFTDGTDLKYFKKGDVVQGNVSFVASVPPTTNQGDVFAEEYGEISSGFQGSGANIEFTFIEPIDFQSLDITQFAGGAYAVDSALTFEYTDDSGNKTSGSSTTVISYGVGPIPVSAPALVSKFKITGIDGYTFKGFYDSSSDFVSIGSLSTSVLVTDPDNNTMVVSGGNWANTPVPSGENQDQVWSANQPDWDESAFGEAYGVAKAFDGDLTTSAQSTAALSTINFTGLPEGIVKLVVDAYSTAGGEIYYEINGVPMTPANTTEDTGISGKNVFAFNDPIELTSITQRKNSGGGGSSLALYGVIFDNKLLIDSEGARQVTGLEQGATGKFTEVTGAIASLTDVTGSWIDNLNRLGQSFYMSPTTPQIIQTTEMFCNLAVVNNKAVVQSLSESLVEPLPISAKNYTVAFASQLASGNAPDTDLPIGTQIEVTVKATNDIGSDEKTSNAVTPSVPTPADSAGPITDVTGDVLTVGTDNLDKFEVGDSLKMVDSAGAVANFVAVTSGITNVPPQTTYSYAQSGPLSVFVSEDGAFSPDASGDYIFNNSWYLSQQSGSITWTFTPAIPFSQSLRIIAGGSAPDQSLTFDLNNGGTITMPSSFFFDWNVTQPGQNLEQFAYEYSGADQIRNLTLSEGYANNTGFGFFGIAIDGVNLISSDSSNTVSGTFYLPRQTLEFAEPNPDLKYFEVGDVVQANNYIKVTCSDGKFNDSDPPANGFDGDIFSLCSSDSIVNSTFGSVWSEVEFRPPLDVKTTLNFLMWDNDHRQQISINGGAYNPLPASRDPSFNFTGKVSTIRFTSGDVGGRRASYTGVGYDGDILVRSGFSGSASPQEIGTLVKVTAAPDLVANSMTVDGGNWDVADPSATKALTLVDINANAYYDDAAQGTNNPSVIFVNNNITTEAYFNANSTPTGNRGVYLAANSPSEYIKFDYTVDTIGETFTLYIRPGSSGSGTVNFIGSGDILERTFQVSGSKDSPTTAITVTTTSLSGTFSLVFDSNQNVGSVFASYFSDFFAGDTKVTAPAKSGTGTFVATTLSGQMTISNNNGEWIDNGDYFVKVFNTFFKEGSSRDEAGFQAIADAFAAYPGKVEDRKADIAQLVAQVSATLSAQDEALLREIVDLD